MLNDPTKRTQCMYVNTSTCTKNNSYSLLLLLTVFRSYFLHFVICFVIVLYAFYSQSSGEVVVWWCVVVWVVFTIIDAFKLEKQQQMKLWCKWHVNRMWMRLCLRNKNRIGEIYKKDLYSYICKCMNTCIPDTHMYICIYLHICVLLACGFMYLYLSCSFFQFSLAATTSNWRVYEMKWIYLLNWMKWQKINWEKYDNAANNKICCDNKKSRQQTKIVEE